MINTMKKNVLLIALSFNAFCYAQIGIKKDNPHSSADLELGSENKTLLLNRVANTNAVPNPVDGMMIYDQSEECVKAYQAGKWSKCLGTSTLKTSSPLHSLSLSCSSATLSPAPKVGQPYKGMLVIPYTGGDGSSYQPQSIQANGLTAELAVGNFVRGNGSLQYSVTGIPDKAGNITFNVNIAGKTCSVTSK